MDFFRDVLVQRFRFVVRQDVVNLFAGLLEEVFPPFLLPVCSPVSGKEFRYPHSGSGLLEGAFLAHEVAARTNLHDSVQVNRFIRHFYAFQAVSHGCDDLIVNHVLLQAH